MKTTATLRSLPCLRRHIPLIPALLLAVLPAGIQAQGDKATVTEPGTPKQTKMDLPGDFHKYFGQRVNQFKDLQRKVAKLDLDADLSYDGIINGSDPADGGAFEQTPPGLVIGTGEMSRFLIRVSPYRVDFDGDVVITLEVAGINRDDETGQFTSLEQEVTNTGRIRVWKAADRKELLLDSADPNRRFIEWVADARAYPANLPTIYPRFFFVEGVKASPKHLGDLRILVTISHRNKGETRPPMGEWLGAAPAGKTVVVEKVDATPADAGYNQRLLKAFRTSFDHILVTVGKEPHPKVFVNNNIEGDWLSVAESGSPK
jgi:hypothetical protein